MSSSNLGNYSKTDTSQLLINVGANVNNVHLRQFTTPLDNAKAWKRIDIEEFLYKHGAKFKYDVESFQDIEGGGILAFISSFGQLFPDEIAEVEDVNLRLAVFKMKNSKYVKMLFTHGLYKYTKPMLELVIILPADWNEKNPSESNQFPIQLLEKLAIQIKNGLVIDKASYQLIMKSC